jgi:nicotinamide-nucleotide amidase
MNQLTGPTNEASSLAQQVAQALDGRSVATAESITSGNIASALAAAENASVWFKGSVVAYAREVKYSVLGVDRGPVITSSCVAQMATSVSSLLDADISVGTTGAGGPGPEEGQPPGTVFIAIDTRDRCHIRAYRFEGEPADVVHKATIQALRDLADVLTDRETNTGSTSSERAESTASRYSVDAHNNGAEEELSEPHIEQAALTDAPGS